MYLKWIINERDHNVYMYDPEVFDYKEQFKN